MPLGVLERLRIEHCLAERRSKGKLFTSVDRCTGQRCLLRKIYLDVTNAGQDDGLPTSVLREIAHLKALDHRNVGRILRSEVRGSLAVVVYEYHHSNLKDYFKKHCLPLASAKPKPSFYLPLE